MTDYTTQNIAQIVNGSLIGQGNTIIKYLLVDSRKLISSSESIFFAIVGERHNGHDFIENLFKKGVNDFVISSNHIKSNNFPGANFILVDDTLKALQRLCESHRKKFDIPVIGVTGSNGKTVIKEWLFQILNTNKKVIRSPKSYNSQLGVPLSVWLMEPEHELGIFEAGISKSGEMKKLQAIIKPDFGIFTNIGEAHQENFKDLEEKVREKLKLFEKSRTIIYCKDHKIIHKQVISGKNLQNVNKFSWSVNSKSDLTITKITKNKKFSFVSGIYKNQKIDIEVPFNDSASVENSIHVLSVLLLLGYKPEFIRRNIKILSPVAMRLELKRGINNCTIINDSYNSDLSSLNIALDVLNQQHQHSKKTVILSDIFQSGRNETDLYSKVAEMLNKKDINHFIGIGNSISNNHYLFDKVNKHFFRSTNNFLSEYPKDKFKDEAILLKGSRDFEFEKISSALEQKVHRTVMEINLNALIQNLNYFRSLLNPSTKIMAMVKAFSYGSGTFEIANLLQFHRIDYLGVAFADEGVALRKAGITLPVMVMSPEVKRLDVMVEYNLEPEIYSYRILKLFDEEVKKNGITRFPVHIKIDTGMHRLGFSYYDIQSLIKDLVNNRNFYVKTIFSHLAASDDPDQDFFTQQQIKKFEELTKPFIDSSDHQILRHILNSSGIERFPEAQFDMVRLGIGLYGISALKNITLTNVSTLKSTISQIKRVNANDTIGYGREGISKKDIKIAIIPIGYADGLNRKLGNGKGLFYLNGKFVPTIGNICMDMCMLNISGIKASEGDEVIIFGDKQPVADIAEKLETVTYEVLTGISERVQRIYYQE